MTLGECREIAQWDVTTAMERKMILAIKYLLRQLEHAGYSEQIEIQWEDV